MLVAAIRPDSWNVPLFLHVLGALVLTGAMITVAASLLIAWRAVPDGEPAALLRRLAFRTLLLAAIPAYVVMRVGAQWISSKEGLDDANFTWIGIGYMVADLGAILLIIATIVAGLAARRDRAAPGRGRTLASVAGGIGIVLVVADLVAIWAMAGKPA